MANAVYNSFINNLLKGNIDLVNDTIKVALMSSSYTPDIDTHEYFSDLTGEATGGSYTSGGSALAGKTVTTNTTIDVTTFDATDLAWVSSSITARGCVLYKDTGNPATSYLICYKDFGDDRSSILGDFTIQWDSSGILALS